MVKAQRAWLVALALIALTASSVQSRRQLKACIGGQDWPCDTVPQGSSNLNFASPGPVVNWTQAHIDIPSWENKRLVSAKKSP